MLRLSDVDLDNNPGLIQPPGVDDNIVVITLKPDASEIIKPDIIDVALSYSIAKINVILELPFEIRNRFETASLASLICNGGWSISLLPPANQNTKSNQIYCEILQEWYVLWRSETMCHFEWALYPITPYVEYLTTGFLIDKHKDQLSVEEQQKLIQTSQNPADVYLSDFIKKMKPSLTDAFKREIKAHINQYDRLLYEDISLIAKQFEQ